jgi:general L-amino acid transport system permease protein
MARSGEAKPERCLLTWDWLYDPKTRGLIFQILLLVGVAALFVEIALNTAANLKAQNIATGFGFLDRPAGFDISQTLVPYASASTYGQAFWVGLTNTLLVAVIGIVLATILGFVIGLARLSTNWMVARLATVYVEIVRNVPLLLQLFAWYFTLIISLPLPEADTRLPLGIAVSNRGISLPAPIWEPGLAAVLLALIAGGATAVAIGAWAKRKRLATGEQVPAFWYCLAAIVAPPLLMFLVLGLPFSFEVPTLGRYNFEDGIVLLPELMALLLGLTLYTAAFIAEIVRSGIEAVPRGQKEAARALGLRPWQVQRLVVIPQALRVIIPPLTNQYLNLTKNSSLAVAIGYPDLVSVFAGTVLNQTNQAVEVILITMAVYLTISLLTAAAMNWFNARMALVER